MYAYNYIYIYICIYCFSFIDNNTVKLFYTTFSVSPRAEDVIGGDLYDFLDEKPPEKPRGLARAASLPPGARSRPSRSSLDDRPPAPLGTDANTLEGEPAQKDRKKCVMICSV